MFGPLFLSHALPHLQKGGSLRGWKELPAKFDKQYGVDNAVADRIEKLFNPKWHVKYRTGISNKHNTVYNY